MCASGCMPARVSTGCDLECQCVRAHECIQVPAKWCNNRCNYKLVCLLQLNKRGGGSQPVWYKAFPIVKLKCPKALKDLLEDFRLDYSAA